MTRYTTGQRLLNEERVKRQYFANTLRTNLLALVQQTDGRYPWESGTWQDVYPNLSRFLNNTYADFGGSDEEYSQIIKDYLHLSQKEKWILESLHESHANNLRKYAPPKPRTFKTLCPILLCFGVGIFLGWLLF